MLSKFIAILSIPLLAAALPTGVKIEGFHGPLGNFAGCSTVDATLTFPEGQTALSVPEGQVPNYILLGTGVQNYTCCDAGTYTYALLLASVQETLVADGIVDLPAPSLSSTTSLACSVPQNSPQSRTPGSPNPPISSRSGFFLFPTPLIHLVSDLPTHRPLKTASTPPHSSSLTTTSSRTRRAWESARSLHRPGTAVRRSPSCRRRPEYPLPIPTISIGCS